MLGTRMTAMMNMASIPQIGLHSGYMDFLEG
jgi:hypothetical protein